MVEMWVCEGDLKMDNRRYRGKMSFGSLSLGLLPAAVADDCVPAGTVWVHIPSGCRR